MSGLNDVKNQINTHLQSILCIFTFTKMEFLVAYEDRHYKHGFSRYLTPLTTTKNISSHGTSLLSSHGTSLISSHGTSLISNHFKRRDNFLYHSVFSSITPQCFVMMLSSLNVFAENIVEYVQVFLNVCLYVLPLEIQLSRGEG